MWSLPQLFFFHFFLIFLKANSVTAITCWSSGCSHATRRNVWLIRPICSLPLGLLLYAFLSLPLARTIQAPGWWCLGKGVNSERTSPLPHTHSQQKWSEDASSLPTKSPPRKPFSTPSSPDRSPHCPRPWHPGGTCAAGARPARMRREEAPEIRSTVIPIAYPWKATRRYGCADQRTLPLHNGPPASCLLHSTRDPKR